MNWILKTSLGDCTFASLAGRILIYGCLVFCLVPVPAGAQRTTVSLDGTWSVADGVAPNAVPATFSHTAPVPGLAHSATPAFPKVDQYQTHEWGWTVTARDHILPPEMKVDGLGRNLQSRNYFWYKRTFRVPERKQRARLIINKAQFGTAVWLNGKQIGEHMGRRVCGPRATLI